MSERVLQPRALSGVLQAPPSKSCAHRALLAAALAPGQSILRNLELSQDIVATLGAIRALGATAVLDRGADGRVQAVVSGTTGCEGLPDMDCGESGSALRFLLPVALAVAGGGRFTGAGRLGQRSLEPYFQIFAEQGIAVERGEGGFPLTVRGRLQPGTFALSGAVSSQFFTGLLLALPLLGALSELVVTDRLESSGYVAVTRQTLAAFGVETVEEEPNRCWRVPAPQAYCPQNFAVEGDWSQAAYPMLMGLLAGPVALTGLRRTSAQGDQVIVDLYQRMGGKLDWQGDRLTAQRSQLAAITADVSQCPDLAPALAAAMAVARGQSRITGGHRLRDKESDRIASIAACLNALGADARETEDGLVIEGRPGGLTGGAAHAQNDHRIAMMAAALTPACAGPVRLADADTVAKSWPRFWQDWAQLGGEGT